MCQRCPKSNHLMFSSSCLRASITRNDMMSPNKSSYFIVHQKKCVPWKGYFCTCSKNDTYCLVS